MALININIKSLSLLFQLRGLCGKLYGNPDVIDDKIWTYKYKEMKIEIETENKVVTRIFLDYRMEKSINDQKEMENLY